MQIPEDKLVAIRQAIYAGASRKLEAIKLVREAAGCGLKEAKEFVEKTAAELYEKEPQKFASPPSGKSCAGVLMAGTLVTVGALMVMKRLF